MKGQVVGEKFFRRGGNVILLRKTTDGVYFGYSGNIFKLRLDDPILNSSKVST